MFTIHYRNYMRTSWRRARDVQRILHFRVTGLIFADSTGVSSLVPASFSSATAISWTNEYLRAEKIEKERERERESKRRKKERERGGNIYTFIHLFIYDRDIWGLIPRAKTCREAIPRWPLEFHRFYTITRASQALKKRGRKKTGASEARRGINKLDLASTRYLFAF